MAGPPLRADYGVSYAEFRQQCSLIAVVMESPVKRGQVAKLGCLIGPIATAAIERIAVET